MGNFWTNPVRHPEDVGVQAIRRTITLAEFTAAGGLVPIGALEAGAIPLYAHATVQTAFNAASTNVLLLGTSGNDDAFMEAADIDEATPGFYGNQTGADTGVPLAADAVVYAKYSQSGTAATTGKVTVILEFLPKREIDGIPFPNN